jgi:glycerol-3-phosphate dehydrogenase subunit C
MWQAKTDYITKHGVSFKHKILGMPEILARLGTAFAPLANWMMSIKPLRIPMEFVAGIDRKTNLPTFHFNTFRKWFRKHA